MMKPLPHLPLLGISLGCAGAFFFTVQDAAFKWLLPTYAIAQIVFLRSLTTFAVAAVWVRAGGGRTALRVGRPGLFLTSFVANISAWFCFYTGLAALPLTVALCVFFLVPVFIALLSVPILGEKPTWRQSAALACGFAGVFVITNPLAAAVAVDLTAVAWILAAVVLWAITAVTTRLLQPFMTVSGTLFHTTIGFLLISGALQWFFWTPPTAAALAGMLLIGLVSAVAQSCVWGAYRNARSAVVATTEYTALVWGALFGWLLWGDEQTPRDLIGAVLIITAGVMVLLSPRRRALRES